MPSRAVGAEALHGPPPCGRDPLVAAIMTFVARAHASDLDEIRAELERAIDEAGPSGLRALAARLAGAGADWAFYPSDPLARRIHHLLAARILRRDTTLLGAAHLGLLADRPVVIVANHLSYSDANLLDVLFTRVGTGALHQRLTVVAGPKVYSNPRRRFSSLCFGTVKTPQSSARSSDEAVMNAREVARAARRSIEIARERLRRGDALLVFAEGTRSRTGAMQPLLPGVARYLENLDGWILPVGLAGTERLFPIGEEALHPVHLAARVAPPIEARLLRDACDGDRRRMMDVVGLAIAEVLPEAYRGVYARSGATLEEARLHLRRVHGR